MKEVKILISDYKSNDYFYICHIFDTIIDLCISNEITISEMCIDKNGRPFIIHIQLPKESTTEYDRDKILNDLMFFKEDIMFLIEKYSDKMKNKLKHSYILFVIRLLLLLCGSKANVMYDYFHNDRHDINVIIHNSETDTFEIYKKVSKVTK